MLTPGRALTLNADSGRPLPRIDALEPLYRAGTTLRHGEVTMVVGRSGSQKSGFALWLVDQLDLPTLYFSADMSPATASGRVASTRAGLPTAEVERIMEAGGEEREALLGALRDSKIQFAFGNPITWRNVDLQLDAYVEVYDRNPEIIVFDNLMDFDGADSEYAEQMAVMQGSAELSRERDCMVLIMHHATDKNWDAKMAPFKPPSRDQVKGGLSEKPGLSLSVALDPESMEFHIATIKQRWGPSDPTARRFATIICEPSLTRFHRRGR